MAAPILPVAPVDTRTAAAPVERGAAGGFASVLDALSDDVSAAAQAAADAATGRLVDLHDFSVAALRATTAISLAAAVRDRVVEAYQEIMRMQI